MEGKKLQHKVIITENENDVNEYLTNGWLVKNVVSNNVHASAGGKSYTDIIARSKFCFILEKYENNI